MKKTIREWEKLYRNKFFNNNLFTKTIKELSNITYKLNKPVIEEILVKMPIEEEYEERDFIIKKSIEMYKNYFEQDIHTRRASFVNNYDGKDNHCISYFHYYIRNNILCLNVYVRSMNFVTNFVCDNQTFIIAFNKVFDIIKQKYNSVKKGYIKVNIFSLHKYIN
ncbi:MAG: hypothetical protein ISS28_01150 [Candidatus Cloacimonetes bacterium]|nr:hypothetical protein [Actinomycetota bacterium]MBL7085695.1 hypothetical protein [Candidatus Cloacimonadota bacterium]